MNYVWLYDGIALFFFVGLEEWKWNRYLDHWHHYQHGSQPNYQSNKNSFCSHPLPTLVQWKTFCEGINGKSLSFTTSNNEISTQHCTTLFQNLHNTKKKVSKFQSNYCGFLMMFIWNAIISRGWRHICTLYFCTLGKKVVFNEEGSFAIVGHV